MKVPNDSNALVRALVNAAVRLRLFRRIEALHQSLVAIRPERPQDAWQEGRFVPEAARRQRSRVVERQNVFLWTPTPSNN